MRAFPYEPSRSIKKYLYKLVTKLYSKSNILNNKTSYHKSCYKSCVFTKVHLILKMFPPVFSIASSVKVIKKRKLILIAYFSIIPLSSLLYTNIFIFKLINIRRFCPFSVQFILNIFRIKNHDVINIPKDKNRN